MKKRIPVEELQFGMFVGGLDRPWLGTPFLYQGFVLRTQQELDDLKRHCREVFIDTEKADPDGLTPAPAGGATTDASALPGTGRVVYRENVEPEAEWPKARESLASGRVALEDVFQRVQAGSMLESSQARTAVGNMTASMLRNPDALMLFAAMRERGGYQLERAVDVSVYMIAFARFLGMSEEDIELAGLVGLLQDIGMLELPPAMLQKAGRLEPAEYKVVRSHVARGSEILAKTSGLPPAVATLASLHHERYDGSGYPRGLKGDALGVIGAIAGIVDTFDALTVKRPYAEAMSPSNALNLLFRTRSRMFHPVLVEQFIRCVGYFPVGSVVELNSGEIGVVIAQNVEQRLQPKVMVVRDAQGQALRPQKFLNLAKLPKSSADEPYRIRRTLEYGRAGVSLREVIDH
ncbi:MAG TPA: HD-GYP domain-containing protein [Burkholderiales bacterium]|nr:HD-GYP domain-containing protein [Burkholderiales bacterium]